MIGPLPYIGGKNRLASVIISLLAEHTTYVEPFAGGAQVLFHKTPSNVEVVNDLDFDIVNFFRVCQWHYEELIRYLRYCVISRKWHDLLSNTRPETLTDIQRAGRFFYLQKNSFGGLVLNRHYHYGVTSAPNYNLKRIPEIIEAAHKRLQNVQVECSPYERVLDKYDRPTTFFYIDPPYYDRKLYKHNFQREDFQALADRLAAIKGKFLLSLNDHPEVRRLFAAFQVRPVELAYTAKKNATARYTELLIANYDLNTIPGGKST
ncbi:MAG TPA: DNA adenine methylase [Bryobacteraceae bacterium]|jgi:DNA adenine methylase|nr:DNA adenine methylase [Bryobacteraceae bacterium]